MALRSQPLNILSICTGGGGLDLGVELAIPSARTVCMVEREAFAVAQLVSAMEAGLMAPAPIWSDARTLDGRAWRGSVDGFIGGIPCQPHSLAGRKRGSNDERDLWSTARRLIVQSRVWFVLIENVAGMLSAGDDEIAGAERVYRDLLKLGFQVEGGLFTAEEVGASHQRERVFIIAVADPGSQRRQQEPGGSFGDEGANEGWPEKLHHQSERVGADLRGVGQADTYGERLERIGANAGAQGRADAGRSTGLCGRATVVDPESFGRREGRTEPELWGGRYASACSGEPMVDTHKRASQVGEGDAPVCIGRFVQPAWDRAASRGLSLFPPGPADRDGWRSILERAPELEPAFRRVADGLASRLDIARVDRLRMLGNGVVPLEAAYAVRTLVTRLAARGSAGAARLVRMMEGIEA